MPPGPLAHRPLALQLALDEIADNLRLRLAHGGSAGAQRLAVPGVEPDGQGLIHAGRCPA